MGNMSFPSSASQFASVTVVLRSVGEQIRSQRLLCKLVLLNKFFNEEFTPFLYRDVRIQTNRELLSLLRSAHLVWVKRLTMVETIEGKEVNYQEANELVQQLLANTPNLKSFKWIGIPLATATIVTLHQSCKKIKSIHINYPYYMDDNVLGFSAYRPEDRNRDNDCGIQKARALYSTQDFTAFTDLEELVIDNMGMDVPGWRRQLGKILENSPRLQKLGLSISIDTIQRLYHYDDYDKYIGFFDSVCEEYASSGGSPLHLQTLKFGAAVYPQNAASLHKLTDLSYLEEVYIENDDRAVFGNFRYYYDREDRDINFDAILSPKSRSLRRFSAFELDSGVYRALCRFQAAGLSSQLAISFKYFDNGYETAQLFREDLRKGREQPFLPMQSRMIDLELRRDKFKPDVYHTMVSAQQVLDDLVSTNSKTLEGLMVRLPENLAIDVGFDHLDELQGALQGMPNLTQLVIGDTRWSNKLTSEMLKCAAQKLANAVPQLRYINVYRKFWHICQGNDADGKGTRRLKELEEREKEDVELFGHTILRDYWSSYPW